MLFILQRNRSCLSDKMEHASAKTNKTITTLQMVKRKTPSSVVRHYRTTSSMKEIMKKLIGPTTEGKS